MMGPLGKYAYRFLWVTVYGITVCPEKYAFCQAFLSVIARRCSTWNLILASIKAAKNARKFMVSSRKVVTGISCAQNVILPETISFMHLIGKFILVRGKLHQRCNTSCSCIREIKLHLIETNSICILNKLIVYINMCFI